MISNIFKEAYPAQDTVVFITSKRICLIISIIFSAAEMRKFTFVETTNENNYILKL